MKFVLSVQKALPWRAEGLIRSEQRRFDRQEQEGLKRQTLAVELHIGMNTLVGVKSSRKNSVRSGIAALMSSQLAV